MAVHHEVKIDGQGMIVINCPKDAKSIEIGVDHPCCQACAGPLYFLSLSQARELRQTLTDAILELQSNVGVSL